MQKNSKICSKCPYDDYETFVPFEINGADVLFVGEAPGATECKTGRPFTGKSGELLRKELLDKYLGEGNYDIANVVACRPPKNEVPKAKVRNLCTKQFINPISKNYKYIVLLGETAFRHFFPKDEYGKKTKYGSYVNNFLERDNQVFYMLYHPAYVTRNTAKRLPDYKKMFLRWYNRYKDRYAERQYVWVKTVEEFDREFSKIEDICAVDVETEELYGALKSVAIAYNKNKAFSWLVDHEDNYDMSFKAHTREKLQQLLLNKNVRKVFHNAKYDVQVLLDNKYKIHEGSIDDTMILAYLHNDTETSYGLKELTAKYLNGYNDIAPFTNDPYLLTRYNCEDTDNTLQLYHLLMQKHIPMELYRKVVMPAMFMLMHMEKLGALVDKDALEKLKTDAEQQLADIEKQIHEMYPKESKGLLLSSPDQVADFLYNKLKYPVLVTTGKNKPSTNKEALARLVVEKDAEVASLILDYRKAATLHNNFLTRSLLGNIKEDGRIHTKFNLTVTATGRLSSSKPNLQNMPRRNDVRNVFVAPPDYYIMDNDLSQIELRVIASIANEKHMIAAYKQGLDLHTYTAAHIILNTAVENITKEARSRAKPVNFGFCLTADTHVLTATGEKPITDIQIGDLVYTHKHNWKKVVDTQHLKTTRLCQITTNTGKVVKCTPDHMWLTMFSSANGYKNRYGFVRADELCIGDSMVGGKWYRARYEAAITDIQTTDYDVPVDVYDITVEDDHSFVANGLFTHNCYGMMAKKFLVYALISYGVLFSLDEAQKIRARFFRRYNGLLPYYREVERQVKFKRYIESPMGRRRYFPPYLYKMNTEYEISSVFRKAVNAPIQGTASDIMMLIGNGVRKVINKLHLPIHPFLTVHDSIMYYVHKDYVEDAYNIVHDVTESVGSQLKWLKVPLIIESSIGKRWGSMKPLD